jgi:hypothetical protein
MSKREPTHEEFLKDVADHHLQILRSQGVERHIRLRKPGTVLYGFDILTWPGCLCITGDMGTYVFSRIQDMFEFFRSGSKETRDRINPGYWAEKLLAVDKCGSLEVYSEEKMRQWIGEYLNDTDASAELRTAVQEAILDSCGSDEREDRESIDRFEHRGFRFRDSWEANFKEYSTQYIWCCRAIVWAIEMFDKAAEVK